jgi:hypothetical protein
MTIDKTNAYPTEIIRSNKGDIPFITEKKSFYHKITGVGLDQFKIDINFWGQRTVQIDTETVAIRSLLEKTLSAAMELAFYSQPFTWEEREQGEKTLNTIKEFKKIADSKLPTKNWFTRLLAWFRDFSLNPIVSNSSFKIPARSPFRIFKADDSAIKQGILSKKIGLDLIEQDRTEYAFRFSTQIGDVYYFQHLFDEINLILGDRAEWRKIIDEMEPEKEVIADGSQA